MESLSGVVRCVTDQVCDKVNEYNLRPRDRHTVRLEDDVLKEGWVRRLGDSLHRESRNLWMSLTCNRLLFYLEPDLDAKPIDFYYLDKIETEIQARTMFQLTVVDGTSIKIMVMKEEEVYEWVSSIEITRARYLLDQVAQKVKFMNFAHKEDITQVTSNLANRLNNLTFFNNETVKNYNLVKSSIEQLSYTQHRDMERIKNTLILQLKDLLKSNLLQLISSINFFKEANFEKGSVARMVVFDLKPTLCVCQGSQTVNAEDFDLIQKELKEKEFHEKNPRDISSLTKPPKTKHKERRTSIPKRIPCTNLKIWEHVKDRFRKKADFKWPALICLEPLTLLQKETSKYLYAHLLDSASKKTDVFEQMAYVAAFATSVYSDHPFRDTTPFLPLLGETYECDRNEELGWKSISECVNLHPLTIAHHCKSADWCLWHTFTYNYPPNKTSRTIKQEFYHLEFHILSKKFHYAWNGLPTYCHESLLGNVWLERWGQMKIFNHDVNAICTLKFRDAKSKQFPFKVMGMVKDCDGFPMWILNGTYDTRLEGCRVKKQAQVDNKLIIQAEPPLLLWQREDLIDNKGEMYFFSSLEVQLNEPEPGVAPTDSRHRPDLRAFENRDHLNARILKKKLLALQKERIKINSDHKPMWFTSKPDNLTDSIAYSFNNNYWECKKKGDFKNCPDLFAMD